MCSSTSPLREVVFVNEGCILFVLFMKSKPRDFVCWICSCVTDQSLQAPPRFSLSAAGTTTVPCGVSTMSQLLQLFLVPLLWLSSHGSVRRGFRFPPAASDGVKKSS
eukprot:m.211042 g.211042  ORF g.211042 m.211042 type:complete len:107 (-) comp18570_c2_seq4:2773-3093(-)